MRTRYHVVVALASALTVAVMGPARSGLAAQAPASQSPAAAYAGPRTADGRPDLNGIWQVLNSAHWDIEAHSPEEGVPGGQGVVEGGPIPYQPWAVAKKKQNHESRATADPLSKCYLPCVPRVTYVPLPFEIVQTPKHVV